MIFILNKRLEVLDTLNNFGDLSKITPFYDDLYAQDLASGAETYSFSTLANTVQSQHLVVANYIAFNYKGVTKLFHIIHIEETHEETFEKKVYCEMAGIELINEIVRPMKVTNSNLRKLLDSVLAETDWKLGKFDASFTQIFDFEINDYSSVYSVIQEYAIKQFGAEISFRIEMKNNTVIGQYVDVYKKRGKNDGFRFDYTANLSEITRKVDTSDLCTALIGVGKNNVTFKEVETGDKPLNQDFITNESAYKAYNNNGSHIMGVFKAETESPQELLKLTREELDKRSKPKTSYELKVELLGREVNIGDTVYIFDGEFNPPIMLEGRVSQLKESFTDESKNECILANFKEIKSNITDELRGMLESRFPIGTNDILNEAITGDKISTQYTTTVIADAVIATKIEVEDLIADKATIKDLEVVNATIEKLKVTDLEVNGKLTATEAEIEKLKATDVEVDGTLKANYAEIEKLKATNVDINGKLNAVEADIGELNAGMLNVSGKLTATEADIKLLKADVAEIDHVLAGNITADNMQAGTITAGSGIIAEGAIGSAEISELDAGKISAGKIDTSKVEVTGEDGHLRIKGNRMQVFQGVGSQAVERVSVGDVEGDGTIYGLRVRGADGQTILLDENGVKSEGITNGAITNDKISNNAEIDGAKLNINSVVTKINEDGTEVIKGTKIEVDGTNLTAKLSTITEKQTEDGNKITKNATLIKANEDAIKLKVDEQTYTTDKNQMSTQLNKNTSSIDVMKNQIALKVEQTDITNSIENLKIGGRNLLTNSNKTVGEDAIREFVQFADLAPVFDKHGLVDYTISFEIKSKDTSKNDSVQVYMQNGSGAKYEFSKTIKVTTEFQRLYVTVKPKLKDETFNKSILAFFGIYDTGNIPVVRDVKVELGTKATDWTPAPEDITKDIDEKISTAKGEIKITTDAITQNVSKLETSVSNKADGSTVSTLSSKVGSLETSVNGIKGQVSSLETTTEKLNTKVDKSQTDAEKAINDAKEANDKAKEAQNSATTANSNATNAQNSATTANNKLGELSDDNKLTAIEKQSAKLEWDVIVGEKNKIVEDANRYGQSTTDYLNKYNNLNSFITPLLSNLTTTSDIVGTTFRSNFTSYYNSRQDLLNAISTKAKALADQAQSTANTAKDQANANKGNITGLQGEVSTVKSNVSNLTIDLNKITQRVQSTENTTSTLTSEMGAVDGKINTAKNQAVLDARGVKDTRSTNESPSWYFANYPRQSITEFKLSSVIDIPNGTSSVYGVVTTNIPWNDSSGGYPVQTFRSNSFPSFERVGISTTSWSSWKQIEDTIGSSDKADKAFNSAKTYTTTELKKTNDKVSEIVVDLNKITQRVQSTESKTATLEKTTEKMLINNFSKSGNIERWTAPESTIKASDEVINYLDVRTASNVSVVSDRFEIDSTKTYKMSLMVFNPSENATGSWYFGIFAFDKDKRELGVYTNKETTLNTNPYFIYESKANKNTSWRTFESYVYAHNTTVDDHTPKGNCDCFFKFHPKTKYVQIRFLNYRGVPIYGDGQVGSIYFAQPTISEVDSRIANTESRLKTAELQITENAITTTVKKNFYTKSETEGQITSKGYQTSSEVQQKVDQLQIKFEESGGYNLLYNSAFANNKYEKWHFVNGAEYWDHQSYYKSKGDMWIKNSNQSSGHFGLIDQIKIKPNIPYSVSFSASKESNVKGGRVYLDCYDSNGVWATTLVSDINFDGKRHSYSFVFGANVDSVLFYIEHQGSTTNAGGFLININKPCFTEGSISIWSPHPSEVYDGITSINKDGIKVSNSNSNTYTEIDNNSFSVNDNNNGTIAEFSQTSLIPNLNCPGTLRAGYIYANNVVSKTTEYKTNMKIIFIQGDYGNDSNNGNSWATSEALRTVNEAIRRLPDIINQHIEIHIGGSVSGFELSGKSGCGTITFIFEDDCVVNSNIVLDGVSSKVILKGTNDKKGTLKKEIYGFRCSYLHIHHLTFRGSDTGANVLIEEGTNAVIEYNDMGHTWCAISVNKGCSLAVRNNVGSNLDWYIACSLFSRTYFKSYEADYVPDSKHGLTTGNGDDGTAYVHRGANVNFIKQPSAGWNPNYTPTQRVTTWGFNSIWSDETLNGWSNVNELVQGYASTWNTGRWTGYMQMHDGMADIRSNISGGINLSGRIYIQRRNSSGNSTGSKLHLYASDGTLITNSTTINRGQGVWVHLNSSIIQKIQSGAISYFYLRADGNNTSTYFKCESNAKIEITYTK